MRTKEYIDQETIKQDIIDFLSELLEREELNDVISGITKQLKTKGYDSLSLKQTTAIDSFIEQYKKTHKCERCENGNVVQLMDYIEIEDNNGFCPMCEYDKQQFMKD